MSRPDLELLPQYKAFLEDWRHVVCLEPRASGKSINGHSAAVYLADNCRMRVLCLRELQNSIDDSSKAEIEDAIERSGKQHRWIVNKMYIKNRVTGSIFMFRGVNNKPKKLKSLKDIDLVISEECEDFSQEVLDNLIPTIRKEGSSFWWFGNVGQKSSPMRQMFVEGDPPPGTIVLKNTYLQNPFVSKELLQSAEHLKKTDYDRYRYIYLGEDVEDTTRFLVTSVNFGVASKYPNDLVVFGVDIARSGGDRTVIAVRIGRNIVKILPYGSMDLDKLVIELNSLIYIYKPDIINVDSTGHGAWVPDALKAKGIIVNGVCFSENAWHEDKYKNKRTEIYALFNEFKSGGGVISPEYKDLEIELVQGSQFTYDNKDRPMLKQKDEVRKIISVSPDQADSVNLSLCNCNGDMFAKQNQTQSINAQSMVNSVFNSAKW